MPTRAAEVDRLMAELTHPLNARVEQLRAAILDSNEQIIEHVKWKGPSFCYGGEDRVTFKLYPADRIQLIFHRGAKVRSDSEDFTFDDPTGLLKWAAKDRAVVTFLDLAEVEANKAAVVAVVNRWIKA
jgi:hypothetical protein